VIATQPIQEGGGVTGMCLRQTSQFSACPGREPFVPTTSSMAWGSPSLNRGTNMALKKAWVTRWTSRPTGAPHPSAKTM